MGTVYNNFFPNFIFKQASEFTCLVFPWTKIRKEAKQMTHFIRCDLEFVASPKDYLGFQSKSRMQGQI